MIKFSTLIHCLSAASEATNQSHYLETVFTQFLKQIAARFSFSLPVCLFHLSFWGHFPLPQSPNVQLFYNSVLGLLFSQVELSLQMILSCLVALKVIYTLMISVQEKLSSLPMLLLQSQPTTTLTTFLTSDVWDIFFFHTELFCNPSWVSYTLTQFCNIYLETASDPRSLRAQFYTMALSPVANAIKGSVPQDHPSPSSSSNANCKSKFLTNADQLSMNWRFLSPLSSGLSNLLEWLTELRKTVYLLFISLL